MSGSNVTPLVTDEVIKKLGYPVGSPGYSWAIRTLATAVQRLEQAASGEPGPS